MQRAALRGGGGGIKLSKSFPAHLPAPSLPDDRRGFTLIARFASLLAVLGSPLRSTLRAAPLGAAPWLASMSMSYAGPCSGEIDRVQARVDAKLDALAA